MSNNPTRYIKSVAHQPVDPGIHGQIVDSMSNTTDKRTNAPSIRMAMSNGLPAGAIVEYTGNEVPDGYRRRDDIPTLSELNDNLSGFKFYPTGTDLVALVADDKFYKDNDGKYVLADSATGQQLLEDTTTYKRLASTEDCRGEAGADSAVPFKGGLDLSGIEAQGNTIGTGRLTYSPGTYGTHYLTSEVEYVFFKAWAEGKTPTVSVSSSEATVTLLGSSTYTSAIYGRLYKIEGKIGDKYTISTESIGSRSGGVSFANLAGEELSFDRAISWNGSIVIPSDGEYYVVYGTGDGAQEGSVSINTGVSIDEFSSSGSFGVRYLGYQTANTNVGSISRGLGILIKKA